MWALPSDTTRQPRSGNDGPTAEETHSPHKYAAIVARTVRTVTVCRNDPGRSEEDGDVMLWDAGKEPGESPMIGETLGLDEKGQLTELLQEFRDVLQNQPGKRHVA